MLSIMVVINERNPAAMPVSRGKAGASVATRTDDGPAGALDGFAARQIQRADEGVDTASEPVVGDRPGAHRYHRRDQYGGDGERADHLDQRKSGAMDGMRKSQRPPGTCMPDVDIHIHRSLP